MPPTWTEVGGVGQFRMQPTQTESLAKSAWTLRAHGGEVQERSTGPEELRTAPEPGLL